MTGLLGLCVAWGLLGVGVGLLLGGPLARTVHDRRERHRRPGGYGQLDPEAEAELDANKHRTA